MTRTVPIALMALGLLAGCGNNAGTDPNEQVRATVNELAAAAKAHQWGDFCAASTKPDKCENAIATARAMGVDIAQFIPSGDVLENAKITVTDDHATVDATAGKDAQYVRQDGRWLWVWKGN